MNIDEILSLLNNPINKWLFGVSFGVLLVIGYLVVGLFRSLREKDKGSKVANRPDFTNQPMSSSETIGDISQRLGEDIRDVWMKGYSDDQINGVLTGKYTLEDLYKMKPDGRHRV